MQPERAVLARAAGATVMTLGLMLTSAMAASAASPSERLLIPSAGWHGRPIEAPHRHDAVRTATADRPLRGWSAGPVSLATGQQRPSGSIRVREVQRRLRSLGYRPGPIDGIFGPRTQAAVGWFQYKHGLHVDGRATLITVRHLRARTSPSAGSGPADPGQTSSTTWAPLRTAPLVVLNLRREPVAAGGWGGPEPERPPVPAAAEPPQPRERSDA